MGDRPEKLHPDGIASKARRLLLRLSGREYLPMVGGILMWATIAAAVGHADGVRLLTALVLVQTARTFTMLDAGLPLRRRFGSSVEVLRKSKARAIRIELASLAAALLTLSGLIFLFWIINQETVSTMAALMALGLPARHFGPASSGCRRAEVQRAVLSWSGFGLALAGAGAGVPAICFALLLAIREWLALAVTLIPKLRWKPAAHWEPATTPLNWREVAGVTGRRARHRLVYRVGKSLLGIFGPIGNLAARTARGMGAHRRVAPTSIALVSAIAGIATLGAAVIPIVLAKPATMLISAVLLRIAAAAGNVLLWWRMADMSSPDNDDEDEDD